MAGTGGFYGVPWTNYISWFIMGALLFSFAGYTEGSTNLAPGKMAVPAIYSSVLPAGAKRRYYGLHHRHRRCVACRGELAV